MSTLKYHVRTAEQLGPMFTAFRKQNNLTQAELAERLGVGQQTVSQLERNPAKATVERLLKALAEMQVELHLESKASTPANPTPPAPEKW